MRGNIAIIYNRPEPCRYYQAGEEAAVIGVLEAADAVSASLEELGYSVTRLPLTPPLEQAAKQLKSLDVDLVFNLFEGFGGCPQTEADLADILTLTGKPYTGCPGAVLRLALDKAKTNALLKTNGITVPDSQLLDAGWPGDFHLDFPCIVKPPAEDASHGLSEKSVVHDLVALRQQLKDFSHIYSGQALVEGFIDGREFNITIMGNSDKRIALPVSEIAYTLPPGKPRLLTYAAKWQPESLYYKNTQVICPAQITDEERKKIEKTAIAVFGLLGCCGYARVDMRMDDKGRLYVIEVNPNPDISPSTGAARQAQAAGLTYVQFIDRIIQLAQEQK